MKKTRVAYMYFIPTFGNGPKSKSNIILRRVDESVFSLK